VVAGGSIAGLVVVGLVTVGVSVEDWAGFFLFLFNFLSNRFKLNMSLDAFRTEVESWANKEHTSQDETHDVL